MCKKRQSMRGKRYEREQEVIEKNKQGIGGREK
jgi:hypothetical protein